MVFVHPFFFAYRGFASVDFVERNRIAIQNRFADSKDFKSECKCIVHTVHRQIFYDHYSDFAYYKPTTTNDYGLRTTDHNNLTYYFSVIHLKWTRISFDCLLFYCSLFRSFALIEICAWALSNAMVMKSFNDLADIVFDLKLNLQTAIKSRAAHFYFVCVYYFWKKEYLYV